MIGEEIQQEIIPLIGKAAADIQGLVFLKTYSRQIELRLFSSDILSTFTHRCECWKPTKGINKISQCFAKQMP